MKAHKKSTLMHYTKEELIGEVMMLENNIAILKQTIDQQYINAMKLLDDMKLLNDTHKNSKTQIGVIHYE